MLDYKVEIKTDIKGKTFEELEGHLIDVVQTEWMWKENVIHKFTFNDVEIFDIKPQPTDHQKGNGKVEYFGKAPKWKHLEPGVNKLIGTDIFEQEIDDVNKESITLEYKAKVLLMFEIARRVDDHPFLSRKETKDVLKRIFAKDPTIDNLECIKYLLAMLGSRDIAKKIPPFCSPSGKNITPKEEINSNSMTPELRRKFFEVLKNQEVKSWKPPPPINDNDDSIADDVDRMSLSNASN